MSIDAEDIVRRLGPHLIATEAAERAPAFLRGFGPDQRSLAVAEHGEKYRPAAVLVPLIARPRGVTVMMTERSAHLPDHAGQISFPGGRLEEGDRGFVDAALREAREEVGLMPQTVRVLGALEQRSTISNYRVTPIVALADPFEPLPQASEVAAVFEVPLAHVFDARNYQFLNKGPDGTPRRMYAIPYDDWFIFGFTARILLRIAQIWHGDASVGLFPHESG